ncbi:solute carrier organic anion transporter family member 2A1-like [Physella acuta]|uniref:solute carrier organic anion transporter family member 2A1-like n=1 Tax=Physella acuta TaxID=109671 RepID=UPI0027DB9B3D|nr:solute carrier organic anion transporter family member 2A1-like [Physella acuta]
MMSRGYKIVSQNGNQELNARSDQRYSGDDTRQPGDDKDQTGEGKDQVREDTDLAVDTRCGVWTFKPDILQPCANIWSFTLLYSLAALLTSTLTSYVNSQVTTLERQFGLNSKQTGLILAANDVGFLICVLFVSYSAPKLHIPRSLGIATITFGVSGLACSLPHFIFGARSDTGQLQSNVTSSRTLYGAMCDGQNQNFNKCASSADKKSHLTSENTAIISVVIIFLGMMIQGFGKAPRTSFTVMYIDDNTKKTNTGIFMGIIVSVGVFGPVLAYLLGGVFTRMYVTLKDTQLTPTHPRWIGAWWLGYLTFGCLALMVSVPLFCFPRKLPQKVSKKQKKESHEGDSQGNNMGTELTTNEHDNQLDNTGNNKHIDKTGFVNHRENTQWKSKLSIQYIFNYIKEFLVSMVRLLTNPVYVCMVISACFLLFAVSSGNSYTPKYLEAMFNLPAYKANYVMATKSLFASTLGTFIGGYLTKRIKMTTIRALKFIIVVTTISFFACVMAFFFQCQQPPLHNWPSTNTTCNTGCQCADNSYFAICGQDGKTYYSPCTAGCSKVFNGVYQNCTCIPGGQATSGYCDYGCDNIYGYAFFFTIRFLVATLSLVPKILVVIRSVDPRDKSLALGFQAFMTSIFGWLLGPVIIGYVIDGICVIWDVKCSTRGRCLLYDNEVFNNKLHGYISVATTISIIFLCIAYVFARKNPRFHDNFGQNDLTSGDLSVKVSQDNKKDSENLLKGDNSNSRSERTKEKV